MFSNWVRFLMAPMAYWLMCCFFFSDTAQSRAGTTSPFLHSGDGGGINMHRFGFLVDPLVRFEFAHDNPEQGFCWVKLPIFVGDTGTEPQISVPKHTATFKVHRRYNGGTEGTCTNTPYTLKQHLLHQLFQPSHGPWRVFIFSQVKAQHMCYA